MTTTIAALRASLADRLAETSPSQTWPAVFRTVNRHNFAPRFAVFDPPSGSLTHHDTTDSDPARQRAAFAAAYSDNTLITRFDEHGSGISSSTEPSLMATMLDALDLHRGHRVLEIGTGTGYNAALLSEFAGSERVTTIDVEPELITDARAALQTAGYAPTVVCGDGSAGVPERAPYDRIIATCGVDRVPATWLDQLADDGAILVTLANNIVLLRRIAGDTVCGRFFNSAGFMPLRSTDYQPRWESRRVFDVTSGHADGSRRTTVPDGLDFQTASFFTSLIAEHSHLLFTVQEDQVISYRWVHPPSGSWARIDLDEQSAVHQSGPRRLWDELEPILDNWHAAGRPTTDRYGLTVWADGTHVLWSDKPEIPVSYLL